MAQSISSNEGSVTMSEQEPGADAGLAEGVDVPEAAERIRVSRGTVSPETRERLLTLKARRYLKYKVVESVETIIQVALECGMDVLERDLNEIDPAA